MPTLHAAGVTIALTLSAVTDACWWLTARVCFSLSEERVAPGPRRTRMDSGQGMLTIRRLPDRNSCLQNGDYISIADGLLERRCFEIAQQFKSERFQILDSLKSHTRWIRRGIIECA